MAKRVRGEGCRTTMICIDSYENGVPKGRIYHSHLNEARQFHGTMQFLQDVEQLLNEMEYPKAFTAIRTFAQPAFCSTGPPEMERQVGKEATFALRILFRQNASWQGSVTWVEGQREQGFRSVLELLFLMNSALLNEEEVTSA